MFLDVFWKEKHSLNEPREMKNIPFCTDGANPKRRKNP